MMPSTFDTGTEISAFQIADHSPRCTRHASEPLSLWQPPWPRNMCGELASIAELMA
jgi:hypothetical protein